MQKPIAQILRERRKSSGFTQEQMAKKINLTKGGYAALEQGRALPDIFKLIELTRIYNFSSIDNFLELKSVNSGDG